jgi:CCR4-NOT transcription complex subunit 1
VFLQVLKDDLKFTNKKFDFAVTVLDKIRTCLAKQPEFCEGLLDNDHLLARSPELVNQLIGALNPPIVLSPEKAQALKAALEAKLQPKVVAAPVPERPPQTLESDLDLLESEDRSKRSHTNPDKEKKLMLFLNNLTFESLNERHKELDKLLDSKEFIKWVSYHIVFRRIPTCNQPNSFEIYVNMLGKVPRLERPVTKLTYKILQKWFRLTGKSVNDNKLKQFKNLGYWLGRLTIARNEPVLINRLNLKEILINSYQKVRLLPNVEVIVKILEARKDSQKVFCLRNPWLFPIICVLRELNEKVTDNQIKN